MRPGSDGLGDPATHHSNGLPVDGLAAGDVLVAGTAGPLLSWTFELLAGAMSRHHPSVAHLAAGDEVPPWPAEPGSAPAARLFVSDFINDDWAVRIRSGVIPAVLVVDDEAAAWDHLRRTDQPAGVAIRNLVAVATALGDVSDASSVLLLTRRAWADPSSLAERILEHVGLPLDRSHKPPGAPRAERPAVFPAEVERLIKAAVRPAFHYARTGIRSAIAWPRDCLFWGDQPGEPAPRVLDLTGPARVLAYGPYYAVPSGQWTVRATLAFSPSSRGAPLALELHGATRLGRFAFAVAQPGLFAVRFAVTVPSPRESLEIRLVTERGAIEGTLGLDRIDLIPAPDVQSVT